MYNESAEKIQKRVDDLNEAVLKIEELDQLRYIRLKKISDILVAKLKDRYLGKTITLSGRKYEVFHITARIPRLFCHENEIYLCMCFLESNVTDMTAKEKKLIEECRTLKRELRHNSHDLLDEYRDDRLLEIISYELPVLSHKYGAKMEFSLETGAEGFVQCIIDPSLERLSRFKIY